jgi:hypothetical protein
MSPRLIITSLVGISLITDWLPIADQPVTSFPYTENFESVVPPNLPPGWITSTNRTGSGDFTTEDFQGANRLLVRNATIEQSIMSPHIDLNGHRPEQISFTERRSGTFVAELELSVLIDDQLRIPIGRTSLEAPNVFIERSFIVPRELTGTKSVRFEWKVIPAADGSSGLLRIDEVAVYASPVYDHDLRITHFSVDPPFVAHTDHPEVHLTLYNAGILSAENFNLLIRDSSDIHVSQSVKSPLIPGDSLSVVLTLPPLLPGAHTLTAVIDYPLNQQTESSWQELNLYVSELISRLPWNESFDTAGHPIPPGWRSSYTGSIPDAELTTSIVQKGTYALLFRNATRQQYIVLPPFDPSTGVIDTLRFFERRTGTFDATVSVDISFDGGKTFSPPIATFEHTGETDYRKREVDLSGLAYTSKPFYIRLFIEGNGTGTTGTVRFDDFTLSGKLYRNISLSRITHRPEIPFVNETIHFTVTLLNNGLDEAFPMDVQMHKQDRETDVWELLQTISLHSPLRAGEQIDVEFIHTEASPVPSHFMFRLLYASDQDTTDNSATIILYPSPLQTTVVINEIMYAPQSPEPEWLELYNSGSEPVTLTGWSFSDRDSLRRYYLTGPQLLIDPGAYVVITKDESLVSVYKNIPSPVIFVPAKPTFLWNSQGDAVILYDYNGTIHDRVEFTPGWGGTGGRSLERIDFASLSQNPTNWGSSLIMPTPGRINSIGRREHDLAIGSFEIRPETPLNNERVEFSVNILNSGYQTAESFTVNLYSIRDSSQGDPLHIVSRSVATLLLPLDSLSVALIWNDPPAGYSGMRIEVVYEEDQRPDNNTIDFELLVRYPLQSLVINEILYQPVDLQPEYVEIYNPGNHPVDLRGWSVRDRATPGGSVNRHLIGNTTLILSPGGFAVLASDTSLFTYFDVPQDAIVSIVNRTGLGLNITGDDVILLDPSGYAIDSVAYEPSWHHPDVTQPRGRSLERISLSAYPNNRYNWSTSADTRGGTPGKHNSLYTEIPVTTAELTAAPNPFSPTGDGYRDHTLITYNLPEQTSTVRLRIFDSTGRPVRTLLNNSPSGPRGSVIWDGRYENGRRVRLGIYILLLEAYDGNGGGLRQIKNTVIVADRL